MISRKLAAILIVLAIIGTVGITQCNKKECQCSHAHGGPQ